MPSSRIVGVLMLSAILFATPGLTAFRMEPRVLMVYGGSLPTPIFIVNRTRADVIKYQNFWCGSSQRVVAQQVTDRPYFNVAMFWGISVTDGALPTLKPENAHQHGRLYVATSTVRAAAVSTTYAQLDAQAWAAGTEAPLVRPVPRDLSEFKYGNWLSEAELQIAEDLGVRLRKR